MDAKAREPSPKPSFRQSASPETATNTTGDYLTSYIALDLLLVLLRPFVDLPSSAISSHSSSQANGEKDEAKTNPAEGSSKRVGPSDADVLLWRCKRLAEAREGTLERLTMRGSTNAEAAAEKL